MALSVRRMNFLYVWGSRNDAQPCVRAERPSAALPGALVAVLLGARSTRTLGVMAITLRRLSFPSVSAGAHSGRASASRPHIDTSPCAFVRCCASVNGAARQLAADVPSPRCPRNVSLRRAGIGRGIMKSGVHVCATRAALPMRHRGRVRCPRVLRSGGERGCRREP